MPLSAAVRKLPSQNTGASLPTDGLAWQNLADNEIENLWRYAFAELVSVGGTANAITASSDSSVVAPITAYARGQTFCFTPTIATNTSSMTINIDAVGVVGLLDASGNALPAGTVVLGRYYIARNDGANFRIIGGSASAAGLNNAPDAIFVDEKSTGTNGGTFAAGAFAQRTLNTTRRNVIPGCSLAGNQFTLAPGTYFIDWSAPAGSVGNHQTRLQNVTDGVTVETGSSEFTIEISSTEVANTRSQGFTVVTLTASKTFEIEHICQGTLLNDGFGAASHLAAKEVYTWVRIWIAGVLPSMVLPSLTFLGVAKAASTAVLPANTYANGAAGVGATLTGNANGALAAIDGYTASVNDLLLIKNEAAGANNGFYTLTQLGDGSHPYILTRAANFNQASNIFAGCWTLVQNGSANAGSGWVMVTAGAVTVGTTAVTWAQSVYPTNPRYQRSSVPQSAAINIANLGWTTVTSISLAAGSWDVEANVGFVHDAGGGSSNSGVAQIGASITLAPSVMQPTDAAQLAEAFGAGLFDKANIVTLPVGPQRFTLGAPAVINMNAYCASTGPALGFGTIQARGA